MVFKLQHPIGHQVLAGFPGAWLVLPPVCFFEIRLYTAGGLLSSHWDSVWTTLDTNFSPDPNLTASKSHWRTFPLGKKSKLHEEKYYPKDLGEPMKSEYFPSLSLFWHRTRFEHLVYLIYTFTGSRSKELLGTLDREFINKYLLKICEYELFFFSYIQNVCTIFRCFPSQGSRKVRCEEWEEAWVALTLSGGEPCVCLVISNVWVPLGGPLCSEPGLGIVDNSESEHFRS